MPPRPSSEWIWYGPSRVPTGKDTADCGAATVTGLPPDGGAPSSRAHGDSVDGSPGGEGEDLKVVAVVQQAFRPPVARLASCEHEVAVRVCECLKLFDVQRKPVLQPDERQIGRRAA